jgi:hypothetical protein
LIVGKVGIVESLTKRRVSRVDGGEEGEYFFGLG